MGKGVIAKFVLKNCPIVTQQHINICKGLVAQAPDSNVEKLLRYSRTCSTLKVKLLMTPSQKLNGWSGICSR